MEADSIQEMAESGLWKTEPGSGSSGLALTIFTVLLRYGSCLVN